MRFGFSALWGLDGWGGGSGLESGEAKEEWRDARTHTFHSRPPPPHHVSSLMAAATQWRGAFRPRRQSEPRICNASAADHSIFG